MAAVPLLLLLAAADAASLGHPDWAAREAADRRLARAGERAWPVLVTHLVHPSPEVRDRAHRLLRPWRDRCEEVRALGVLLGPWPVRYPEFHGDHALRGRVHRLALLYGCGDAARDLHPDRDESDPWWFWCGVPPAVRPWLALRECRRRLGTGSWLLG